MCFDRFHFVFVYVLVFVFYLINCQIALVRQTSEPDNKNVCDVNEVKAGGDNSSPTARNLHCNVVVQEV